MRSILAGLLLLTCLPQARAQDSEAEKHFRAMEKRIREARAFEVSVVITIEGDTRERRSAFRGSVLVTRDNKVRLKIKGNDFGEARTWEMVSNGKQVTLKPFSVGITERSKEQETFATPKNLHDQLAARLSHEGVFLNLPRMAAWVIASDQKGPWLDATGFSADVPTKLDGRDARVIRYKMDLSGKPGEKDTCLVWIDTETGLPLKRVLATQSMGKITETYTFTLDPEIGTRAFELPKAPVPLEENVERDKLPPAVVASAEKRFPQSHLGDAVLARPGSEWLRPDQTQSLYLVSLSNGRLHIALWITPEGRITEIINEIKPADLPKQVKDYVEKNYPRGTISQVDQVFKVKEGKETLESIKVFLSGSDGKNQVLVFSGEGKFVEEGK